MISNEAREAASMLLNWLEWGVPGKMRVFEKAFQSVIDAERERCARVAEDWTMDWTRESAHVPSDIAQAIRSTQ